jgi:hypothetical protein
MDKNKFKGIWQRISNRYKVWWSLSDVLQSMKPSLFFYWRVKPVSAYIQFGTSLRTAHRLRQDNK